MGILRMTIHDIKGIENGIVEIPIENGIYSLVGSNGVGKSTIMSCFAQLLSRHNLGQLKSEDYSESSYVEFIYEGHVDKWTCENGFWKCDTYPHSLRFNGTYEGSLFYGMRFRDSKNVDDLMNDGKIDEDSIVNADLYISESLGKILHNDIGYYQGLKRIKNKYISERLGLKNTPYFRTTKTALISQYRMSSGECLLISLSHFIYNSLIRRSLPSDKPIIMLIDEIELALHPVAISNLLDLLYSLVREYENLTVIITSHSPEVIRKIAPVNLFKIERIDSGQNEFNIVNPCYPSYAIRDIYVHDGFDFLLLVEDELAKIIVKKAIEEFGVDKSRLINVLPVGGWENVLKLQNEILVNNVLGVGKQVFSILDGDVKKCIPKQYKSTKKLFLPVSSVEKYLKKILIDEPNILIKKRINDSLFTMKSLDSIITDYRMSEDKTRKSLREKYKADNDGKRLYKVLLKDLAIRSITEEQFIVFLYKIIKENVDFAKFEQSLIDATK